MKIYYGLKGADRKALVSAISEITVNTAIAAVIIQTAAVSFSKLWEIMHLLNWKEENRNVASRTTPE